MGKIDDYIAYMMELVTNPKHGYDQNHRWGEDYDCSSAIITAVQSVIPVKDAGATYTGNEECVHKVRIPCHSILKGDGSRSRRHSALSRGNQ